MGGINFIFLVCFSLFSYNSASEKSTNSKPSSVSLFLNVQNQNENERNRAITSSRDNYELKKRVFNRKVIDEENRLDNVVSSAVHKICPVSNVRKGQIIKTNVSIQAGAKFLLSPSVSSVKQCHEMCCNSNECNTAIVKVENGHVLCYLFDCGKISVCSFDFHKDYKVIELKSQNTLDNTSTAATSLPVVLNVSRNAATELSSGEVNEVHCPAGHHKVASACRADCSNEFYFECANVNKPSYSQCIATYDKCDGYQQCDDNSDEMECPSKQDNIAENNPDLTKPVSHTDAAERFYKDSKSIDDSVPLFQHFSDNVSRFNPGNEIEIKNTSYNNDYFSRAQQLVHKSTWTMAPDLDDHANGLTGYSNLENNLQHKNYGYMSSNSRIPLNSSNTFSSYKMDGQQKYENHHQGSPYMLRKGFVDNFIDKPFNTSNSLDATSLSDHLLRNINKNMMEKDINGNNGDMHSYSNTYGNAIEQSTKKSLKQHAIEDQLIDHSRITGQDTVQPQGAYFGLNQIIRNENTLLNNEIENRQPDSFDGSSYRKYDSAWPGTDHRYPGSNRIKNTYMNQQKDKSKSDLNSGSFESFFYGKLNSQKNTDYAKELVDYGDKYSKGKPSEDQEIPLNFARKPLRLSFDNILRPSFESEGDTVNRKYDTFTRYLHNDDGIQRGSSQYIDDDHYKVNHYKPGRINNHQSYPANVYQKYPSKSSENKDRSYFGDSNMLSEYFLPSDNRLEYYIDYESDPRQLYDYEYGLHKLNPKSGQTRFKPSYANQNKLVDKIRSGYFERSNSLKKQDRDYSRSTMPASTLLFFSYSTTAVGSSTTKIMLSSVLNSISTTPLKHHKVYSKPQTTTSNDYGQLMKLSHREKIDEIRSGAMVALSLGIGLTLVSLVLLACRLQQFRKQGKSRKTKNMNGDSDYLVNGLYL